MADEIDLDTLDKEIEGESRVEKRIKDLSEKVRLTAEERDEQKRLIADEKAKNESLAKENEFLNQFGDALAKYPNASEHRNEIKEKVLKGYSVEDATISTLASKGQFAQEKKPEPPANPAGGSAAPILPASGEKKVADMSQAERREKLLEAEKRGELYVS